MEDTKNSTGNGTGETETSGSNGQNNNGSNGSEAGQTQNNGAPKTVPYDRFKEVNDAKVKAETELATLKGTNTEKKPETSALPNTPENRVLELVGKVPDHLKPYMADMAKYGEDHKMPVEDVIEIFNVKKGHTIPKDKVAEYAKAEQAANDSKTGGSANPAVRQNVEVKNLSDAELEKQVNELASQGQI